MLTSRRQSLVAWLALFAVLYAAATPLFAALRAQHQPDYFGALCTLSGVKSAPAQPDAPAEGGAVHQQHCVFCISGAWQPPLEASLRVPAPDASGTVVPPGRERVHPDSSALLQPLSPRAPPRLV